MWKRSGISSLVAAVVLLAAASWAAACGPFFANTIIDQGDKLLLRAPEGKFFEMAAGLAPAGKGEFRASPIDDSNVRYGWYDFHRPIVEAELADLRAALAEQKVPAEKIEAISKEYEIARGLIRAFANDFDAARAKLDYDANAPKPPVLGDVAIPKGLPAEFEEYFRGAVLYYQAKPAEARKHWQAVLDLPATKSQYRATWAAYMIGRSYCDADPASAAKAFPKVRELAKAGYRDSMELAAASYGWQARSELLGKHYEQAVDLYMLQLQAGDLGALASLRNTCGHLLKENPEILQRVARHDASRQLVTAYIVCNGGPYDPSPTGEVRQAWLAAVEAADLKDLRDADKLAWAAYSAGEFKIARRWLDRCKKDTPIANWVEAKLLLRAGKNDEAAKKLAQAVEGLPRTPGPWQMEGDCCEEACNGRYYADVATASGELAILKLHRCQYVEALDLLYRRGWWTDAALVADRILTVDELAQYVDKNWPQPLATLMKQRQDRADAKDPSLGSAPLLPAGDLRHLLARRLVRAGQLQRAAKYMPEDYRKALDEYAGQLAASKDKKQSQVDRATALWNAARALRENGMELMGYELEPDAAICCGMFEYGMTGSRLKGHVDDDEASNRSEHKIAPPSADEKKRIADFAADPNTRFHYRYTAADMAWQAAAMMPDESDQTAQVLCEAGRWLKNRDPKAADRFYKALVRRCGKTDLGRTADLARWFPPELPPATQPTK